MIHLLKTIYKLSNSNSTHSPYGDCTIIHFLIKSLLFPLYELKEKFASKNVIKFMLIFKLIIT